MSRPFLRPYLGEQAKPNNSREARLGLKRQRRQRATGFQPEATGGIGYSESIQTMKLIF